MLLEGQNDINGNNTSFKIPINFDAISEEKKLGRILKGIIDIADNSKEDTFPSVKEAEQNLVNSLLKIHEFLKKEGIVMPIPNIADIGLHPDSASFLSKLNDYLQSKGYFFIVGVNPLNSGEVLSTISLNKISTSSSEELRLYIPKFFSLSDFNGTNLTRGKEKVNILILDKTINEENGLLRKGILGGVHLYGRIIVFKSEISEKFQIKDQKTLDHIIKNTVIPNEMGHAYGDLLGLEIFWQEPISDLFSMDKLEGQELIDFIISRVESAQAMKQYALSSALIKETLTLMLPSYGSLNSLFNAISGNKDTRKDFLEKCSNRLKSAYSSYGRKK